jgi:dipeptidase E
MPQQHIVALGGGGFSMEASPVLDDYILGLARQDRPRICFVPTASGDNENYIVRFYRRFTQANCQPSHLELFHRKVEDLAAFARSQDIFYVGGGSVANLLAVWRLHGLDRALRDALGEGTVLAGVSAGSLCWFECGVTDSFGAPELSPIECLGFVPGSNCPHYDGEAARRPAYTRLIRAGMPAGLAADDGVALHFLEGRLHRVVSSRAGARAYRVEIYGDDVREVAIEPEQLWRPQTDTTAEGSVGAVDVTPEGTGRLLDLAYRRIEFSREGKGGSGVSRRSNGTTRFVDIGDRLPIAHVHEMGDRGKCGAEASTERANGRSGRSTTRPPEVVEVGCAEETRSGFGLDLGRS